MRSQWLLAVAAPALLAVQFPQYALAQAASETAPGSALAQTAQAPSATPSTDSGAALPEIVVTAQKRAQRANDVGMSITAVSGDVLTERNITTVEGLTAIEPSLQFTTSNFGTPIYTIRGVGYNDQSIAASPTVSVYQDQVAYSFPSLTKGAFLDVGQVEILKGPQGTLYGQNATGGAINIIPAQPTDHLEMGVDNNVARFGEEQISGFISGPLTDTLSARLAASLDEGGAWQKSDTRDDMLGNKDKRVGRLLLDWKPTTDFTMNLNLNTWRDNSDAQAFQLEGFRFANPDYISPATGANPQDYIPNPAYNKYYPAGIKAILANPIAPGNDQAADWVQGTHPKSDEQYYQATVRLDYKISEDLGLTSLSTFENYRQSDNVDYSGLNVVGFNGVINGSVRTYSEELRLHGVSFDQKLNWMVGANYQNDETYEETYFNNLDSSSYAVAGAPFSIFPAFLGLDGPFNNFSAGSTDYARTTSIFANAEYAVLDDVKVHGGVRYTRSDQNFSGCAQVNDPGFRTLLGAVLAGLNNGANIPVPAGCNDIFLQDNRLGTVYTSLNEQNAPWQVGVDWKVRPDDLLYVSVSKGYKAGASPTLGGASYIQFNPVVEEGLLAYEVGAKTAFFDRRVQLDAALFHYDYTNKQVLGRIADPLGLFGAIQTLVNIPRSTEDGMELQARWRPISGLTLNGGATFLQSDVTSDFYNYSQYPTGPADTINYKGESFPNTPKWSLNWGARYGWDVTDAMAAYVRLNGTFQTKSESVFGAAESAAVGPAFDINSYGLIDLAAGLESPDGHWTAELWGKNILNQYYWNSVIYVNDTTVRVTGMPALYGLRLSYRY